MKTTFDKSVIENLFAQGYSLTQVADYYKVKSGSIHGFCKRNNITYDKARKSPSNLLDMTGMEFSALTVIERAGSYRKLAQWLCKCKCGNTCIAVGSDLRQKKTKTCGCRISIETRGSWKGYAEISGLYWSSVVRNAKNRDLDFSITIEHAWEIFLKQDRKCSLSGQIIFMDKENHTASIDRINNDLGYIEGNIQWVHKDINTMKSKFEEIYFINLCNMVSNNVAKRNDN